MPRLMKLVEEPKDLLPTDGNQSNLFRNAIPEIIRTSPAWQETQLQEVVNTPRGSKVQVSMGRFLKHAAKRQDMVPTDANHSN